MSASQVPVVAVIGGGYSGAALAYHLVRQIAPGSARIVVFEPRAMLGGGLAYDTDEAVYRINVPAARMTLVPGDDEHFQRWLFDGDALDGDDEAATLDGHVFARRKDFGRYVAAQLEPLVSAGRIEHRRACVVGVRPVSGERWHIDTDDGKGLDADVVVIATTHPSPQAPSALARALSGHPRYVADTTVARALLAIRPRDRVLIVGSGLTAADVIASLGAARHAGLITVVSRRGLRSRGHNFSAQDPFGDFTGVPSRTAVDLLRRVRRAVADAAGAEISWHAVFDALRGQGHEIWKALPVAERRRLVRFLRPYWDVHRFRIAPQIEAVIEQQIEAGRLTFLAASIAGASRTEDDEILVRLRHRHGRGETEERFDAVVITTGPGHNAILSSQPFLAGLAGEGLLQPDRVGLGLEVDQESRAVGRDGQLSSSLYIAGPLARGTFGELMGLPQVTEHAVFVADRIARDIQVLGKAVAAADVRMQAERTPALNRPQ